MNSKGRALDNVFVERLCAYRQVRANLSAASERRYGIEGWLFAKPISASIIPTGRIPLW